LTFAIKTINLTKRFTHQKNLLHLFSHSRKIETTAVNGITLQVGPGEIFGLVGPNGAGKTTFIKLLCTLLLPSSGEASVYGHDVVREPYEVRKLVGLVTSEERSFFWRLTGRQNLEFFATLYQVPKRQAANRIQELFDLLDLAHVRDVRFNEYSTGMRQKLGIARGLLNQPKVLFMDEPTKGLDPISAQGLLRFIREKMVGFLGSTILMTTHILRDIEILCNRIAIINKGKMIACGSVEELRFLSRQDEQYRLKVRGLSEENVRRLKRVHGVVNCTEVARYDGIVEIEMRLRKDTNALSESLQRIVGEHSNILCCTLEEENFEDVFRNLLQDGETPYSFTGNEEPC